MTEEQLAYAVLAIEHKLHPEEAKIIHNLWLDWGYLVLRIRIMAEGLEGTNARSEIAEWGREAYKEVMGRLNDLS